MAQYSYLGMTIQLGDNDKPNLEYFAHCARHDFSLQACPGCKLVHYPPSEGCPWCGSPDWVWQSVPGRGTVYSYHEVTHAIQPGFAPHLPYLVLLVELDAQRAQPTPDEGLRVIGNLVMADGSLATPAEVAKVGIGTRVKMVFKDLGEGMSIPEWAIDTDVAQPAPWRYPE